MQLSFDSTRLINDIIKALNIQMDLTAKILIEFMVGEVAGMSVNPELNPWKAAVIEALKFRSVATAGQIVREVGVLDQNDLGLMDMALSLEFGTGEQMDSTDNPWYQEFLSSEYYHASRQGQQIYSLPGEDVYDPLTNSWKESNADSRIAMPQFSQAGSLYWTNIFGNSAIMAETYFNKGIDTAIDSIDFSNYLIVSR
ncbi:hypothetical protein [Clostridium estertheticum]|uniref:hypothetical protein n=1 Tax=Clostridium estertheticum TaxID=238834 RepID=UPI001C0B4153|nr:hypothetical protein [Clostridium estertheticum]MBU3186653.1 hypothetical protein [Clostridium estertheticum]